ncbi:FecR family protein [Chitinophaga arvensicola]|uniref:Ferric-dicitrate binding protein FerR, regulates iron transport through sigma-19 n=1 Tax=Chitinophaga arvensicola TaxID=29529 RepID=A0A1I0REJ4_9BACT|nr:FecR domain-containing protein [Chitinophaga arvensicola]SEW39242.1 ferric-dicitrate binding protein FerR, regulates iron transport through sigma-19 [Chitinophaga arvensicola]
MESVSVEKLMAQSSFINYCFQTGEEDMRYWENWLREHPEHQQVVQEAREMVMAAGWLSYAEKEKPLALAQLDEYLLSASAPRTRSIRWYYAAAASLILVFAAAWYFKPARTAAPVVAARSGPLRLQYSTMGHARQGFILPDSSYVLLESNTLLQLDHSFGVSSRSMELNGVAYFKVSPDQHRPFKVRSAEYTVTALGTAFRMTAQKAALHVLLEEGKVMVQKETAGKQILVAYLLPSESLLLEPDSRKSPQPQQFAQSTLNAWKAQEIIFDHTPLSEVVLQLEACYNIKISVEGINLQQEIFSGRFKNDALPAVLDVLCFTLNKQYQFADSTNVLIK